MKFILLSALALGSSLTGVLTAPLPNAAHDVVTKGIEAISELQQRDTPVKLEQPDLEDREAKHKKHKHKDPNCATPYGSAGCGGKRDLEDNSLKERASIESEPRDIAIESEESDLEDREAKHKKHKPAKPLPHYTVTYPNCGAPVCPRKRRALADFLPKTLRTAAGPEKRDIIIESEKPALKTREADDDPGAWWCGAPFCRPPRKNKRAASARLIDPDIIVDPETQKAHHNKHPPLDKRHGEERDDEHDSTAEERAIAVDAEQSDLETREAKHKNHHHRKGPNCGTELHPLLCADLNPTDVEKRSLEDREAQPNEYEAEVDASKIEP